MMRRILLSILCICCLHVVCWAQMLPDTLFQEEFKYRVKQLNEFMARFNGEEALDINVPDSLKRNANLLFLFNHELFKANRDSMLQQSNAFIQSVLENRTTLHFADEDWFAEVLCNCTYKGKEQQIILYLQPEKVEEFQYRWVIIGAKGNLFRLTPPKRNRGLEILPNNHEIAFMALPKIALLGSDNILNYAQRDYLPDPLSAFYALIYTGALKIDSTEKITYHFLEVPGYVFNVERIMRRGNNAGWLISRLMPMSEIDKPNYYKQCLSE